MLVLNPSHDAQKWRGSPNPKCCINYVDFDLDQDFKIGESLVLLYPANYQQPDFRARIAHLRMCNTINILCIV